jgi:hypothetical protein
MMTMPEFELYVEKMPALRAERLLDAASAAHPTKTWLDTLGQAIKVGDPDVQPAPDGDSVSAAFYFNGMPMTVPQIQAELTGALGAGFVVH